MIRASMARFALLAGGGIAVLACQALSGLSELEVDRAPSSGGAAGSSGSAGAAGAGMRPGGPGGDRCGDGCPPGELCAPPPMGMGDPMMMRGEHECRACGTPAVEGCDIITCEPPASCNGDFCELACTDAAASCNPNNRGGTVHVDCDGGCANQTHECRGSGACVFDCRAPGACLGTLFRCLMSACDIICSAEGCDDDTTVACGLDECTAVCAGHDITFRIEANTDGGIPCSNGCRD